MIRNTFGREGYFSCIAMILLALNTVFWPSNAPGAESRDEINARVSSQLVSILWDPTSSYSPQARAEAARALGVLGVDARAAVPELMLVLTMRVRCNPLWVDEEIVRAVGRLGPPAKVLVPALVGNMGLDRDLDRAIRESVDLLLRPTLSTSDVAVLLRRLEDPDPGERLRAAKALGLLGPAAGAAIPALTTALGDRDPDVRRQAFRALQTINPGTPPSQPALGVYVRDLTDDNPAVRLAAAKALGLLGAGARFALPALQAAARSDPDDDVRRVASDAVGRIGVAPGAGGAGPAGPAPGP